MPPDRVHSFVDFKVIVPGKEGGDGGVQLWVFEDVVRNCCYCTRSAPCSRGCNWGGFSSKSFGRAMRGTLEVVRIFDAAVSIGGAQRLGGFLAYKPPTRLSWGRFSIWHNIWCSCSLRGLHFAVLRCVELMAGMAGENV
jgi:hypothetical protein